MIKDKGLKLVKSENDINYYLFKPSLFSLYYNDKKHKHKDEPSHRYSLSHKLHMMWYLLTIRGGYSILYLEQNGEFLSYVIFVKANKKIIKGCDKKDYYTIFLWTYPEHRGKGLATSMARTMLQDLSLEYNRFYKTINKDNTPSIRVAEKSGFKIECESVKKGLFRTIHKVDAGEQYLYCFSTKTSI